MKTTAWAFWVLLVAGCAFMAGYTFPRKAEARATESTTFYCGRMRAFAGDDKTEVEAFQDEGGQWVACVFKRGRCWRGKLELKK